MKFEDDKRFGLIKHFAIMKRERYLNSFKNFPWKALTCETSLCQNIFIEKRGNKIYDAVQKFDFIIP